VTLVEGVILGLVQGLTEFLPVSSSGHLVLSKAVLGIAEPGIWLEVAVHVGTLGSVVLYFWKDLVALLRDVVGGGSGRRLAVMVVVGTIPAGVVGLTLKDQIEQVFADPVWAAWGLIATGVLLFSTRFLKPPEPEAAVEIGVGTAVITGVAQACAILPGISRSGSTIAAALFRGTEAGLAARFSFFLMIPAVGGAGLLTALDAVKEPPGISTLTLALAGLVAFGSGLAAIHLLMRLLVKGRFAAFAPYCVTVGVVALFLLKG
jgi:undecaprenyl-diphosphatase